MPKTYTKTYKSEALAAVHEMMEGLHEAGSIDKQTLREFDEACLAPAVPPYEKTRAAVGQCMETGSWKP